MVQTRTQRPPRAPQTQFLSRLKAPDPATQVTDKVDARRKPWREGAIPLPTTGGLLCTALLLGAAWIAGVPQKLAQPWLRETHGGSRPILLPPHGPALAMRAGLLDRVSRQSQSPGRALQSVPAPLDHDAERLMSGVHAWVEAVALPYQAVQEEKRAAHALTAATATEARSAARTGD